jgi:glycosyltransferase involved in cell wall biosynthesis
LGSRRRRDERAVRRHLWRDTRVTSANTIGANTIGANTIGANTIGANTIKNGKRGTDMRVALLSKTYVSDTAQRQLEVLGRQPGMELTLITPPEWHMDDGRVWPFRPTYTSDYAVRVAPLAFNGHYHLYVYRGLGRILRELQPDALHIDEELYNPAGYRAQRLADRMGIPTVFTALQSQYRVYPPPYSWIERYDYLHTAHIISANPDVEDVIRRKGYRGTSSALYVYGVDPNIYAPQPRAPRADGQIVIGYFGRLIFDKGLGVLIQAMTHLPEGYRLRLIGSGPDHDRLQKLADDQGVTDRVEFLPAVRTGEVPKAMAEFDIFVLPSLTRPNWKEQFGRVLIEAMACGVPVIGSDSGEIPRVVADAGLITPEGDATALAAAIRRLGDDTDLRARYARLGREHVLAHHTLEHVAARFVSVYQQVLAARRPANTPTGAPASNAPPSRPDR